MIKTVYGLYYNGFKSKFLLNQFFKIRREMIFDKVDIIGQVLSLFSNFYCRLRAHRQRFNNKTITCIVVFFTPLQIISIIGFVMRQSSHTKLWWGLEGAPVVLLFLTYKKRPWIVRVELKISKEIV